MLAALLLTLLAAGLLSLAVRWKPFLLQPVCDSLALALILNKLVSLGHFATHEEQPWRELLPLHLCDWATFTGLIALVTRRPLAFELTWFWAMAGTTQALVTPDLAVRPPELTWYTFYISHGGVVAAALLLTWGAGLRTRPHAAVRILAWSQLYLATVLGLNALLGTNYGYLCAKPQNPSLLDHLGPWPWYLFSLESLALALFWLLDLPFRLTDRRATPSPASR
jgi:hypothetical integral membrane protein (TIGR02206 family)